MKYGDLYICVTFKAIKTVILYHITYLVMSLYLIGLEIMIFSVNNNVSSGTFGFVSDLTRCYILI